MTVYFRNLLYFGSGSYKSSMMGESLSVVGENSQRSNDRHWRREVENQV